MLYSFTGAKCKASHSNFSGHMAHLGNIVRQSTGAFIGHWLPNQSLFQTEGAVAAGDGDGKVRGCKISDYHHNVTSSVACVERVDTCNIPDSFPGMAR